MRTALILFVLVASLLGAGCSSSRCGDSCNPQPDCCWTWKPWCCNNWNWYVPCNTLCGNDGQPACAQYDRVPTASCPCK
jgi:hypothetical protein